MDLSILPPFPVFFFLGSDDLGFSEGEGGNLVRTMVPHRVERYYRFRACWLALVCKIPWLRFHPRKRTQPYIPIAEVLVSMHKSRR